MVMDILRKVDGEPRKPSNVVCAVGINYVRGFPIIELLIERGYLIEEKTELSWHEKTPIRNIKLSEQGRLLLSQWDCIVKAVGA